MNIIETRNKLVDLRKQLGITQHEMAHKMNVRQMQLDGERWKITPIALIKN